MRLRRLTSTALALATLVQPLLFVAPALAQAPTISGLEKQCVLDVPYPQFDAQIDGNVEVSRLYFRAEQFPDYYWVQMDPTADPAAWQAVIPAPDATTTAIVYYAEAVSTSFDSSRTDEFRATVVTSEAECDGEMIPVFAGQPDIVVGSTVAGAPAVPPGFSGVGIAGGLAAGAGGGGVSGWVIGLGVVGAVGLGIVILDDDDDDNQPTSPSEP